MRNVDALQQGNPADGGTGGIGVDSGGTQFRDWRSDSILARITGHGADNAYSWEEVFNNAGTIETVEGGLFGDDTDNPAYEVNDDSTVADGTVVELWPNYGPEPTWSFVVGGGGGTGVAVDNVHVVNVYDWTDPDNPVLIGWQCERVTLGPAGGTWPPQVVVPRVVYETVYESENRDPRLRDEPAGFPVGPPDPTDPADATHIIPLFRDEDGNDYIVFWATNTSYTEDVVTYAWDVSTCVLTPTTTNYTITLTVTPPGTPFTGLTLDRFLTPPPPP